MAEAGDSDRTKRLAAARRAYAVAICRKAGSEDQRLAEAFATVRREDFLGPGPWLLASGDGFHRTADADPARLYANVLVAIDPLRGINNGEPALHAACIARLRPAPGETALHIGAGTGYYTAILAELVGPHGAVIGYEVLPDLARRGAQNLQAWPQVQIVPATGSAGELPPADAIYVNAGACRPARAWLAALRPGGRLMFPLTGTEGTGRMLLVTREKSGFAARLLSEVMFIACTGLDDPAEGRRLRGAFAHGGADTVRSLRLDSTPDTTCWYAGTDWWLSTDEPAGAAPEGA